LLSELPFVMKALVTGGAGFIGSHLVDFLLSQNCEVVVLDNLATGKREQVPAEVSFFHGDAGDPELLAKALPGCDAVFHLAAVSSVQDSLDRPLQVHHTNLTATLELLGGCVRHKVQRFVFSSSAAIYGDTGGEAAREDMIPRPLSLYAVQKLASEHYCSVYHRLHGLETVCLRYFNVYGSRQKSDSPYSGVIAKFIASAREGRVSTIFDDGGQTRDFCHVKDVACANYLAATQPSGSVAGESFNIGTGKCVSINQLASIINSAFGHTNLDPIYAPARAAEIRQSVAEIGKSSRWLNWQPTITLDQYSIAHCIQNS
jgi:nucleoside-diphosphate-sugar epimerase